MEQQIERVWVGSRFVTPGLITHGEYDAGKRLLRLYMPAPELRQGMDQQAVVVFEGAEAVEVQAFLRNYRCQVLQVSEDAS